MFVFLRFLFGYFFVFYLVAFLFDLHWRFVHVKRMGVHRNADKDTGETKEPTVTQIGFKFNFRHYIQNFI